MAKKVETELLKLSARVKCGYCGQKVTAVFDAHDIEAGESPCELCGSHGSVSLDLVCPKRNKQLTVTLREW